MARKFRYRANHRRPEKENGIHRGAELKKTLQSSKISEQEAAIHKMAESLVNKILHDPTLFLKQNGMREDKSLYIDTVRKLFKLDE